MELPIKPSSKSEIRTVVQFLSTEKIPTREIHRDLVANVMSVQMICKWCQQFKARWDSIDDEPHAGCPTEVFNDENRHQTEKLISTDCQITLTEL